METFDPYEEIRGALGHPYSELAQEELEFVLASSGFSPEDLEDVFGAIAKAGRTVGRGVQQAMPHAAPVLGGAVQGATAGAALGPYGILGGAVLGGLGSLGQVGSRPVPGGQPSPGVAPSPRPPSVPASVGRAPAAQAVPAAGQLLSVLLDPMVHKALMAMFLGQLGTRTVPIGQSRVPVASIPNMLGAVASRAAAQYHQAISQHGEIEEEIAEDMPESEDPQERADHILALLQQEAGLEPAIESPEPWVGESPDEQELFAEHEAYEPVYGREWED